MKLTKTSYQLLLGLIVLLIAFRVALPYIVKNYVNKTLDELPGYSGHVDDIDIHLIRGAYTIKGLVLTEDGANSKYPFLNMPRTDLSVEWKSLFKGRLVGEVNMFSPVINVVEAAPQKGAEPTREHWTEVVKDLMPITINRTEVINGRINYLDFSTSPDVRFHIHNMHLVALNLANVEESGNKLPATISLTGSSLGGGALRGDMKANVLKEIPDFDMKLKLTGVDLTSMNSFVEAYGKFDVERGKLDMYSELKLINGQMDGYVKPFFEELKVLNLKKDFKEDGLLRTAWEAVAGLFAEAAENQPRDQIATLIPIQGSIEQFDTDISTTVLNVLKHAFIRAFSKGLGAQTAPKEEGFNKEDKKDKDKEKDDKKKEKKARKKKDKD